jgi:glutamate-1-semialdehyde 2,1-aminomutase
LPPSSEREGGTPAATSFARSRALLERAREFEALIDARPALYFSGYECIGGQPIFVEKAEGPYLWDVDGNRYIDLLLGYGSVVLGHADARVTEAVVAALRRGVNPSLLSPLQAELAEKLVALIPAAEQVTFVKTGSDAVAAAVRLARAVTGRETVLQWGQHGWHDWCAFVPDGVPAAARERTLPLIYNDLDHARQLFARHSGDVACVVLMPYEIEPPEGGFLLELQALARANGALFVLDEVRSGFRISLGGAQQYFGLSPDLAAFGKAMGNGHAISVLAGRRSLMRHVLKIGLTVTYYRSPDAMAAALTTLRILEEEDGPGRLAMLGGRLLRGLKAALWTSGVEGRAVGFPQTPFIRFDQQRPDVRAKAMRLFCNNMLKRGVLLTPAHHWFVCTSMREEDIDLVIGAAEEALHAVSREL